MDQLRGPLDRLSFNLYQAASHFLRSPANPGEDFQSFGVGVFSAATAATLIYVGSSGKTESKLYQALHLEKIFDGRADRKLILNAFRQAITKLTKRIDKSFPLDENALYSGFQVYLANKVFLRTGTDCKEEFRGNVKQQLDMEIEEIGRKYRDVEETRNDINEWVRVNTNGQIQNILPQLTLEYILTPTSNMFLINASCLRGRWEKPFLVTHTHLQTFSSANGKNAKVEMMHLTGNFPYVEDDVLGLQYLEIPFLNREASMCIVLPKLSNKKSKKGALGDIEGKLEYDTIIRLSTQKRLRNVSISLPKFKTENTFDLKQLFTRAGLKVAFQDDSNFSNIVDSSDFHLAGVFHKVVVAIDEHGTFSDKPLELPPANESNLSVSSLDVPDNPPPSTSGMGPRRPSFTWSEDAIQPTVTDVIHFTADRPFLFSVRHNPSGLMLFVGRISIMPDGAPSQAGLLQVSADDSSAYLLSPRFLRKMSTDLFNRTRRPSE